MGNVSQPGRTVYLDFETAYDDKYTLRKLSVPEYIHHPDFEILLVSYAIEDQPPQTLVGTHEQLRQSLKDVVGPRDTVVAHNALFEGGILEWVLGIKPAKYFCTMQGSRPYVAPFVGGMSAEVVTKFFGGPAKMAMPDIKGQRLSTLKSPLLLAVYCQNDVEIARHAHKKLIELMPEDEQEMVNLHILKFVRPRIQVDTAQLQRVIVESDRYKAELVRTLPVGVTSEMLSSNPKFAAALVAKGIKPPTKLSPLTGKPTFAFAKKDPDFMKLLLHPDPEVRAMCKARVAVRSSIDSTRAGAFLGIAQATRGWLPVPLLYYGAHTGRASGMQGINMQNLPKKSGIRNALVAPRGYTFVVADLSQIEARITAVLARQWDLVEEFSGDPYSSFATEIYKIPVSKSNPATTQERFVGKTCILGLGYGMSAAKLHLTLSAAGVDIALEECVVIVKLYRNKYGCIPRLWRQLHQILFAMINLGGGMQNFGPVEVLPWSIGLPNGMKINYPNLARDLDGFSYTSWENPKTSFVKRIWGGGLTENIVQALARIIISRAELRLARAGLHAALQVHDELVYVVPDAAVERVKEAVRMALVDPVPWMPRLPIACEVGSGKSYGQAK